MQMLLLWVERGWGVGVCLPDVRWRKKKIDSLISPFVFWPAHSERFLRKTRTLWECHHPSQNGLRHGGPGNWGEKRRWLQTEAPAGSPPQHHKSQQNARLDRITSKFQLAVSNPLKIWKRLRSRRAEIHPLPSLRRNTFNHCMTSWFQTLLCHDFLPYVLCWRASVRM